jgi:hypothetical protein
MTSCVYQAWPLATVCVRSRDVLVASELFSQAVSICASALDLEAAQRCANAACAAGVTVDDDAVQELKAVGGTLSPVADRLWLEPEDMQVLPCFQY